MLPCESKLKFNVVNADPGAKIQHVTARDGKGCGSVFHPASDFMFNEVS